VIEYSDIIAFVLYVVRREIFFWFKLLIAFPTSEVAANLVPALSYWARLVLLKANLSVNLL
jgi:hypothetical protein